MHEYAGRADAVGGPQRGDHRQENSRPGQGCLPAHLNLRSRYEPPPNGEETELLARRTDFYRQKGTNSNRHCLSPEKVQTGTFSEGRQEGYTNILILILVTCIRYPSTMIKTVITTAVLPRARTGFTGARTFRT